MSREGRKLAYFQATRKVRVLLHDKAQGKATQAELDAAKDAEREAERQYRFGGQTRKVTAVEGMVEFECERCGSDTVMSVDDIPVAMPNGFQFAGKCAACRRVAL